MRKTDDQQLIGDDLLTKFTTPDFSALCGDFDAETCALLAVALPEICTELLAYRRQMKTALDLSAALRLDRAGTSARLELARSIIRRPSPIHPRSLEHACRTLLALSTVAAERHAANTVLHQIQGAA